MANGFLPRLTVYSTEYRWGKRHTSPSFDSFFCVDLCYLWYHYLFTKAFTWERVFPLKNSGGNTDSTPFFKKTADQPIIFYSFLFFIP